MQIPKHDEEIKELTLRLKIALARKQGKNVNKLLGQLRKRNRIDVTRFDDIMFRFPCPRCKGTNTKRTGKTNQLESKGRLLCFDCQLKRSVTKNVKITPFFVLTNKQMEDIINLSNNDAKTKKFFKNKYLIKQKN